MSDPETTRTPDDLPPIPGPPGPSREDTSMHQGIARRIPRGGECECTVCGIVFTEIRAFDLHLTATCTCLDPATVVDRRGRRRLEIIQRAGGPTWQQINYNADGTVRRHPRARPPADLAEMDEAEA